MRVVAILASFNEEHFIARCLEHLFAQGVDAYLVDNGSTDLTVEIAERYLGHGLVGVEQYPRVEDTYKWHSILQRKEELAQTLEADWFIHADPDEIRLAPRPGQTLVEALVEVDRSGYNAVNFSEFTFVPTEEAPDHDHPDFLRTMRHYYPFVRGFPFRVQAWKRQPERVHLAKSGGHQVNFSDLRLYPEPFEMRHYPWLSVPHLVQKYVGRRFDARELRWGWHGWRARLDESKVALPSQADLNVHTIGKRLDPSNPRTRHVMEDWSSPAPPRRKAQRVVRDIPDALPEITESRRRILAALGDTADVTFFTSFGNIGDQLIHAGARRLLAGVSYREVRVVRTRQDVILGLDDVGGRTALVTGGGGWCRPFHRVWPMVLPMIEERFERTIVLPSTVDASFEPVREVLANTKALVFAREHESHRQLLDLCATDHAHDTAFFCDFSPYEGLRGEGTLRAYRTDRESATGGETPPGNEDISLTCSTLDEFLWRIARHESVETDRAHVMIAAAKLGKRVTYRATNYHKLPAIAEYALGGFSVERGYGFPLLAGSETP